MTNPLGQISIASVNSGRGIAIQNNGSEIGRSTETFRFLNNLDKRGAFGRISMGFQDCRLYIDADRLPRFVAHCEESDIKVVGA
jgi:hypothetical protein